MLVGTLFKPVPKIDQASLVAMGLASTSVEWGKDSLLRKIRQLWALFWEPLVERLRAIVLPGVLLWHGPGLLEGFGFIPAIRDFFERGR